MNNDKISNDYKTKRKQLFFRSWTFPDTTYRFFKWRNLIKSICRFQGYPWSIFWSKQFRKNFHFTRERMAMMGRGTKKFRLSFDANSERRVHWRDRYHVALMCWINSIQAIVLSEKKTFLYVVLFESFLESSIESINTKLRPITLPIAMRGFTSVSNTK